MQQSGSRPNETCAASFLNSFKKIYGKACVKRVHNNDALAHGKNIKHHILIRRRFYWVLKPLHMMFYRPFDRSIGLYALLRVFELICLTFFIESLITLLLIIKTG